MHGGRDRWSELLDADAAVPVAFPYFVTADVARAIDTPQRWLRLAAEDGLVVTIARGKHIAVPRHAAWGWLPDPVEAAWLAAAARFGRALPHVSALSAAYLHRVVPSLDGQVHVTVPSQTRDLAFPVLGATVRFHQRDPDECRRTVPWRFPFASEGGLGIDTIAGELCELRVTSPAQTVLDLLHSPTRAGDRGLALRAASRLVPGVDPRELRALAWRQRRLDAVERAGGFREPRRRP
ncbi:type IV toxin-antitoxin system AbiEi family antitoxin domain-containing protein [Demequina gelatinilytica]|uniref:type IV toxin-antitoxin system AbiEi family antitoxin domain-containing protein n=1 Tax=Demequina gelatinilytica TaxID=1638980 RepID=UPI00078441D8|nr:hypothetical protein [Demequina gelatinilytica]